MKKLLSGLFFALMLIAPSFSYAQVVDTTPATVSDLDALKMELIQVLLQEVKFLQAQLTALQDQQTTTAADVATIKANTTPVSTGGAVDNTVVVSAPQQNYVPSIDADAGNNYATVNHDNTVATYTVNTDVYSPNQIMTLRKSQFAGKISESSTGQSFSPSTFTISSEGGCSETADSYVINSGGTCVIKTVSTLTNAPLKGYYSYSGNSSLNYTLADGTQSSVNVRLNGTQTVFLQPMSN